MVVSGREALSGAGPSAESLEVMRARYAQMLRDAGIAITEAEAGSIEVADLGLNDLERTCVGLLVYENNDRYCAKEIMLLPGQTCPEHRHPPVRDAAGNSLDPGKRETFRCRWGVVHLFTEGEATASPGARPPAGDESCYTAMRETVLGPGDQYTIEPGVLHWFCAGPEGAVISEFSSPSRDELDEFTDPRIVRVRGGS